MRQGISESFRRIDLAWNELREARIEDVRLDPNLRSFFVGTADVTW